MDLLPGLYTGLCALLLGAALRRWYDPLPKRVLATYGLVLVLLFGPALFGGALLLPLDNLRGHVPFQDLPATEPHGNLIQGDLIQLVTPSLAAAREAFAQGRWPLWNDKAGAGMPLLADPQAQALQPLVWLTLPLPLNRAAAVLAALRVLLALTFTFLLFRRQGFGIGPSLAGSLGYGLGGFVLLWVGWPLANPAALLPLFLYAGIRCLRCGGRRDSVLLAGATFALLLGGHPEAILLTLGLGAAWMLAEVFGSGARREPRRRSLRRAALALSLGAALAAPGLLPALDLAPDSLRADRMRHPAPASSEEPGFGSDLARRWLPTAAPNAYGNSRFLHYWGLSNTNEDAAGFVGTALLLAALLSLVARRRFPQERLTLALTAAALLWLAGLGDSRRVLLLVAFGLAYLGACTLERLRRGEVPPWTVVAAAAAVAALLAWAYLGHAHPEDPGRLAAFRIGWLHWQMRFLVLAVLLFLVGSKRHWVGAVFALGIAAELLLAHGPANPPMPQRLAFPANEPLRFLEQHLEGDPAGSRMAALGRAFPPNLPSLYGLSDARVYNPMTPRAYAAYVAPVTVAWWGEVPEFGNPGHPLYRDLGVRYLLTGPEEEVPPPFRLAFASPEARIYEHPDPLPLLYLSPGTGKARPALRLEEPGRIGAGLGLLRPRHLASRLAQDGGWRLLLDGRRHPTGLEGPFLAAEVPAGRHRIELLYRPRPFLLGLVIAALALAAAVAAWVPPPHAALGKDSKDTKDDKDSSPRDDARP